MIHDYSMPAPATKGLTFQTIAIPNLPLLARVSRFQSTDALEEYHITLQTLGAYPLPLQSVLQAWSDVLQTLNLPETSTIIRRYFCSDVLNQAPVIQAMLPNPHGAISILGQAPLPHSKLALWSYHWHDPSAPISVCQSSAHSVAIQRKHHCHYWHTELTAHAPEPSYQQTYEILGQHESWLNQHQLSLAENVVRTWWFARDIDSDYHGLVVARREYFEKHGLTHATHYIASTGIAGACPSLLSKLSLDSYAISNLAPKQVEFLNRPDFLCPTADYGVTFERATAIHFADRSTVWISGTASIDHLGNVLHLLDVRSQFDRTMVNIRALLEPLQADLADLALMLVYLRDPADEPLISQALDSLLPNTPRILVVAPVCRPSWLIEIEAIAHIPHQNSSMPAI